jgi:hypothetical protein
MPWNAKDKRVGSSWHPGDAVYKTPGTGPKAPTGYAAPGTAPAVAPITGGPEDTRTIAAQAAARAAVESRFQQQNQGNSAALDRANAAYRNQLPAGPNQKFDNISGMRKELEGRNAVQVYKNALPSYASALKSPDTPAGDQDMIYAFAKIMDPNSVVREGEANSVAALGTMGQQIAGSLRKQLDGNGKFTPELRTQLRNTLAGRIAEYDRAYNSERKFFRETAQRNSLNPDDILGPHLGDSYAAIETSISARTRTSRLLRHALRLRLERRVVSTSTRTTPTAQHNSRGQTWRLRPAKRARFPTRRRMLSWIACCVVALTTHKLMRL